MDERMEKELEVRETIPAAETEEPEQVCFWEDQSGIGVIELALILMVLIGLILIFREQLGNIMSTVFEKVNSAIGKL